jgi:hypothetical protein
MAAGRRPGDRRVRVDADNVRFGDVPPGRREREAAAYLEAMERMRREGRGVSFAVVDARRDAILAPATCACRCRASARSATCSSRTRAGAA